MNNETTVTKVDPSSHKAQGGEVPYGATEVRLSARQWLVVLAILLAVALLTPAIWGRVQRLETGPDHRIPYQLSNDYWLFGQRLRQMAAPDKIIVLGDSVVWGEYVASDGTLSHFLNRESGESNRFINAGVNGLFPLAMEGLIHYYGQPLRHQKVIVHCNLLWLTSPKADLSSSKAESFNHSRLVPQFVPRIPCYRADASERLNAIVERNVSFIAWTSHLQDTCFGQKSILKWTLEEEVSDDGRKSCYPNAYRNPFSQITVTVSSALQNDPERGPRSPRHKPWSTNGVGPAEFPWVTLDSSLQWRAFQRLIAILRAGGNDVFVIIGPFNEHMLVEENRPAYRKLSDSVMGWLSQNHVPHVAPEPLPSALYADASHPLTEGYELLAKHIYRDESFQKFCRQVTH